MTTQNTHHEHNDVDASVVEYPSASATAADATTAEVAVPAEDRVDVAAASPESAIPALSQEKATHHEASHTQETATELAQESTNQETPATAVQETLPMQEASTTVTLASSVTQEISAEPVLETSVAATDEQATADTHAQEPQKLATQEQQGSEAPSASETQAEIATAFTQPAQELTISYAEVTPLIDDKAEEVRPFTAFIEEFRQAEAARLQASLHDSQVEAFALLSSAVTDVATSRQETAVTAPGGEETTTPTSDIANTSSEEASSQQPLSSAATDSVSAQESTLENTALASSNSEAPAETVRPASPERAVSPLLRPSSRLRVPRHSLRHQREEAVAEVPAQIPNEETTPSTAAPVEAPAQAETQRPTRRYRFDRPARTLAPAAPTASRVEEVRATLPAPAPVARTEVAPQAQISEPVVASVTPIVEPPRKQATPEPTTVVTESVAAPTAPENGRRRHNHKELPAPPVVPLVEVAAPVAEPQVKQEAVAPEDLPPLEYADLQKASSRRRRRHRSTTSAVAPVVPSTPAPLPLAPVTPAMPVVTPAPTLENNTAYTIVSGYTVNQMNQGNDIAGPFMGPEPSPARGSVFTRDGRTNRAETQRTALSGPVYPVRSGDNGASSASIANLTNVISQAIQTQTDRMVAELRRANQAPTNVSVSLPPFPSTERVGVFVDVANLLYSARTLRITVDFGKLLDFLRGNRRLVRAHAYCPTSPQAGDEQMFLQAVKGLGYRITTKNYKTFSSGAKKADLDLDLCMDVVRLVDGGAVDAVVLVSGDSDFMPMLDYCSDHGVRVEVAAFDEAMSATLRQSCDLFVNLSMLEEIRG